MNRRQFGKCAIVIGAGVGIGHLALGHAAVGMVKAFDKAFIDDTGASAAWYRSAYVAGFRLAVLSTNTWDANEPWPHASIQLQRALDAGLAIAAYTRNPQWWQAGIEACSPHIRQLQFFALDIENDPGVPLTQAMVDGVAGMGVRPVIYSGSGMWPSLMGNDTSFASLPLWDADHDGSGPTPYGGWNTPNNPRIGVQQVEETALGGITINISSFSADFLR